jgi:hypothetical protein
LLLFFCNSFPLVILNPNSCWISNTLAMYHSVLYIWTLLWCYQWETCWLLEKLSHFHVQSNKYYFRRFGSQRT